MKRVIACVVTALCALVLVGSPSYAASPQLKQGDIDVNVTVPESGGGSEIRQAQLRWGLNAEVGGGAFAGGCNFLSAGVAGSTGSSRTWQESDGFFRSTDGNTSVIRPVAGGEWEPLTWQNKCTDPWGAAVTSGGSTATGVQVTIGNGKGKVYSDGRVHLEWNGSFTVAFYGGMTYWSVSNPVLNLDGKGNGQLVGTASGFGADRDDASQWKTLAPQPIVLAEIRGADVASGRGFAVVPQYLGVAAGEGQTAKTAANERHWGSFPESFVAFQRQTGQAAYWFTSGGVRDVHKPASTLYINYDATAPAVAPPVVAPQQPSAQQPQNPVKVREASGAAAAKAAGSALAAPQAAAVAAKERGAAPIALTSLSAPQTLIPALANTGATPLGAGLVIAVSILLAALAVLSMFEQLPWQRRGRARV